MKAAPGKGSLFKNFSTLFAGLLLVQIINFLFSLILPKYFHPGDFAEFGIFTSFVFILTEIVNAKLDIAVILPDEESESRNIADAAFSVAVLLSSASCLVCLPLSLYYGKVALLLPFALMLYGIHQPILVYLNKRRQYLSINLFRMIQVLTTCVMTILLVLIRTPHALILGFILGLLAATLFSLRHLQPVFDMHKVKKYWKQYDQFPTYGTWSALLNNLSRNSVPILLSQFFSASMVGFYSYSTRLLNAPTGMYTSALGQVYLKRASEADPASLRKSTRQIVLFTFLAGIVPTIIILLFGQELFFGLFSGEWIEAGKIAQYLVVWYFLGVIASPVSGLLDIKNKLKFEFNFNAALFIIRVAAIVTGGLLQDFYLSVLLFSITGIVMNTYLLYYINVQLLADD